MNVQLDKTEHKRSAILKSTLELINKNGFHGTPMSRIAQNASVAAGTIYHYFDSKDTLIAELFTSTRNEMIEAIVKNDDESFSFKERFLNFWVNQCLYYIEHESALNFLEQYLNSPYLKIYPEKDCKLLREKIVPFYRSGIDKGFFKKIDYELLAPIIHGSIVAAAKYHLSGRYHFSTKGLYDMATISWDGIKSQD